MKAQKRKKNLKNETFDENYKLHSFASLTEMTENIRHSYSNKKYKLCVVGEKAKKDILSEPWFSGASVSKAIKNNNKNNYLGSTMGVDFYLCDLPENIYGFIAKKQSKVEKMKVTKNKQEQLDKYCKKLSKRELITKTNRHKAEKLALKMYKIDHIFSELEEPSIHWYSNPGDAEKRFDCLLGKATSNLLRNEDSVTLSKGSHMNEVYGNLNIDLLSIGFRYHGPTIESNYGTFDISVDGLLAFHEKIKTFKLSENASKYFKYYRKIRKYCFARYATNGHIILVEKPIEIIKEDGNFRAWF